MKTIASVFRVLWRVLDGMRKVMHFIVLLILEVKVTSFGLLGLGGVASLFFGSILLMDSPLPEMQLGLKFITPIVLAIAGILVFLVQLAVKAQRTQPITGEAGMIGAVGVALTAIGPGAMGSVSTKGEIWTAQAFEPINAGETVRVAGVRGLQLTVEPDRRLTARTGADGAGAGVNFSAES